MHPDDLENLPFRPGQLVEVLMPGEERDRNVLAQDLVSLFKETQSLPQLQRLSDEEIEAEIATYRGAG